MLMKERKKLRDVDSFTILDYIKTSIEILMNMKMEESENDKKKEKGGKNKHLNSSNSSKVVHTDSESSRSMEEPPKDYESMLQKYEAEVRNHIKIEQ